MPQRLSKYNISADCLYLKIERSDIIGKYQVFYLCPNSALTFLLNLWLELDPWIILYSSYPRVMYNFLCTWPTLDFERLITKKTTLD